MKTISTIVIFFPLFLLGIMSSALSQTIWYVQGTYGNTHIREANSAGTTLFDSDTAGFNRSRPQGLIVDLVNSKAYWPQASFSNAALVRAPLNLSPLDSILKNSSALRDVAVDLTNGKVYWSSTNLSTGSKIMMSNLDGTSPQTVINFTSISAPNALPYGIAVDPAGGHLYWTDFYDNKIQRSALNGSSVQDLVTSSIAGPKGIALDLIDSLMYWTEAGTGGMKIQRAKLNGSSLSTVLSGLLSPNYIALDLKHSKMYWSELGDNSNSSRIRSANLDGTSPATFIDNLTDANGVNVPLSYAPDHAAQTAAGGCTAQVSFSMQEAGNPSFTYSFSTAGTSPFTSPHAFSIGANKVYCFAGGGLIDSFTVTITGIPPAINTQPQSTLGAPGDSLGFTVATTGAVSYQWRKGNANLLDTGNVSGSQTATLSIHPAHVPDTSSYYNVIVSGNCGSTISDSVQLMLNPLAVQLEQFSASSTDNRHVAINWSTLTETNNYGFYIERREKQTDPFATVSELIPGAGTSEQEHHYSYVDSTAPAGNNFYRLKQVDLNGGVTYSFEIIVRAVLGVHEGEAPRVFRLEQNYPNPFNPTSQISFTVDKAEPARLAVYNVLGEEVALLFNGSAEPGRYYTLTLDGSKLGSGLYFYRLVTPTQSDSKKMVLVK